MIHAKRKAGYTISQLSLEYHVAENNIRYLCRLLDRHGPDIPRQDKIRFYSPKLKRQMKSIGAHQAPIDFICRYRIWHA